MTTNWVYKTPLEEIRDLSEEKKHKIIQILCEKKKKKAIKTIVYK